MALEAAEQIANMMVMDPYPGFEGEGFSMPCRNVVPKPRAEAAPADVDGLHQPRHDQGRGPNGLGALAFSLRRSRARRGNWADDLLRHHQVARSACRSATR